MKDHPKPTQWLTRRTPVLAVALLGLTLSSLALAACAAPITSTAPVLESQRITPLQYQELFGEPASHVLIDVRTPAEFGSGHLANAINIAVESLPDRLDEVPLDIPVVVYCRSGNRSATATRILVDAGYRPIYDLGGIQDWIALGLPIEQ